MSNEGEAIAPSASETQPPAVPPLDEKPDEAGYYEAYAGFARTVRGWFMAFGIGGPALFITHPETWKRVHDAGWAAFVGRSFLAGVVIQVLVAITFKTAMWYSYLGEAGQMPKECRRYRVSEWISKAYFIEFLSDALTLALFGGAAYVVFRVLALE